MKPLPSVDQPTLFAYEESSSAEPIHVVPVRAHVRRVRGEAPPSGAERRDHALSAHEQHEAKAVALAYVREKLAELYEERKLAARWTGEEPHVTGDDADRLLREWSEYPRALASMGNNWRGAIFNPRSWERTGHDVESTRPHMRSTRMACWRLRGEQARRSA